MRSGQCELPDDVGESAPLGQPLGSRTAIFSRRATAFSKLAMPPGVSFRLDSSWPACPPAWSSPRRS